MSKTNSNKAWDNELLSAYVDGELAGEELAQVEERLRTDPEARQMVAELQELSTVLRALPRETVGKDLRTIVLQQGEKTLPQPTSASRRWMWAALAVAATLALTVYMPEAQEQNDLQLVAKVDVGRRDLREPPQMLAPVGDGAGQEMEVAQGGESSLDEVATGRRSNLAKAVDLQPKYSVHVTFTEVEKFTKLLSVQGLSFHDAGEQKEEGADQRVNQRLLVEGAPEQIERLLAACHADTRACQSVRITGQAEETRQLQSWYRWQRKPVPRKKQEKQPRSQVKVVQDEDRSEGLKGILDRPLSDLRKDLRRERRESKKNKSIAPEEPAAPAAPIAQESVAQAAEAQSGPHQTTAPIRVLFILQEGSN